MARDKECQDVYDTLNEISQPSKYASSVPAYCFTWSWAKHLFFLVNVEDVYAFSYVPSSNEFMQTDGWNSVGMMDDYARLGVPNETWVETDFNAGYAVSFCLSWWWSDVLTFLYR